MDETLLVKHAVSGDKEAFAGLYTRWKDSLYRYAYFRLGNANDAQDAVSACIVSAYENIAALRSEKSFRVWIFRILYHTCCACIRQRGDIGMYEDVSVLENMPADSPDRISAELREALDRLLPEDRDIVLLSVVAGYNSREIASMTGLKSATIRSRLSRSLAKMRTFLE